MALSRYLHLTNHRSLRSFALILCFCLMALSISVSFLKPTHSILFKASSFFPSYLEDEVNITRSVRVLPVSTTGLPLTAGSTQQSDEVSPTGVLGARLDVSVGPKNATPKVSPGVSNNNISVVVAHKPKRVQQCVHPKLYENDPVMFKHVKVYPPPVCTQEEWLYVDNGTVRFSSAALKKYNKFTCDYYPLKRESESKSVFLEPIRNITDGFKMTTDFFKGVCKDEAGHNNTIVYSGVHYSEGRATRSQNANPLKEGFEGLSIAILGFDSMSRMSWHRRLKKTRQYFLETMKAIELRGHNIVGDGTTAVILPMLTGKFEWELPECRVNKKLTTTLDKFPWVWRDMQRAGYLTSWCNADPGAAAFNWRMNGFQDQPTDFYTRPFYKAIRKKKPANWCDQGQTVSRVWLDYFRDIFRMYPSQRKFLFHFITDFSHDDNNHITKVDGDLEELVKFLHTGNYLNNTLLILMGDHGGRYPASIRASWQGKMEERLPYFGFAFPPWYERKYPQAVRNLRVNTGRLTTPFDLHETFRDFLRLEGTGEGDVRSRGISLFKEVPPERTCEHADVAVHWCACLDWKNASLEDPGVQGATRTALDTINKLTSAYRGDCAYLSVGSVDMASTLEPKREVLTFKAERLEDRKADLSGSSKGGLRLYQLMITTQPGGARFEVTVSQDVVDNTFSLSEKEISRINRYGDDPACILKKNMSIRAYCYCKSNLKS